MIAPSRKVPVFLAAMLALILQAAAHAQTTPPGAGADIALVEYRIHDGDDDRTRVEVSGTSTMLSGLRANTAYDIRVAGGFGTDQEPSPDRAIGR
jgi:hypothetical protein